MTALMMTRDLASQLTRISEQICRLLRYNWCQRFFPILSSSWVPLFAGGEDHQVTVLASKTLHPG